MQAWRRPRPLMKGDAMDWTPEEIARRNARNQELCRQCLEDVEETGASIVILIAVREVGDKCEMHFGIDETRVDKATLPAFLREIARSLERNRGFWRKSGK